MILARHFYMIRHGETEANAARIMAGHTDSPLTPRGRQQARDALAAVRALSIKPQTIVHSHLSRARDTAAILNEALGVAMHEDPDLAEHFAGEWEGVSYDDCREVIAGWVDPPGGEPFEDFFERVKGGKNRALEQHPGPVLIVCHGGLFRAFGKFYEIENQGVENCHLYEFEPHLDDQAFPWRVWQYDLHHDPRQAILRRRARVYHQD